MESKQTTNARTTAIANKLTPGAGRGAGGQKSKSPKPSKATASGHVDNECPVCLTLIA